MYSLFKVLIVLLYEEKIKNNSLKEKYNNIFTRQSYQEIFEYFKASTWVQDPNVSFLKILKRIAILV